MKIIKTKLLYGTKMLNKKSVCCPKATVGKIVPNAGSIYNKGTQTKISSATQTLDLLLTDKEYFAYSDPVSKLLVFEYGKDLFLSDGSRIKTSAPVSDDSLLLATDILWEMECNGNTEMSEIFHDFCKLKLPLPEVEVAKFCDSYYFHNVKVLHDLQVEETLTFEEIEAGVRSGLLKKTAILSDLALPERMFKDIDKVKKVEKKEEPKKKSDSDFLTRCKNGEFIIDFPWTEEQKKNIRPLSYLDDMVPNEFFEKLVRKIHFRFERVLKRMNGTTYYEDGDYLRIEHLGKDSINVSFVGKPGTGKSHNIHAAAAACGIPIYVVNLSHNTDEDRFEGLTKIVNGKPMAIPTEAVNCFKYGGILLLEEVNLAQAAVVMGALGQAIEDPYILKQDGYHDIYRHPLCVVASTTNKGTSGTKTVAEQFSNRFETSYEMNDPDSNEFVDRLIKLTGEDREICEKVYDCYEKVVDFINTENALADVDKILNSLSLRTCVGAIKNMQEGSSFVEAIQDSIIGKIAEQDGAVAENCKAIVNAISFKKKR